MNFQSEGPKGWITDSQATYEDVRAFQTYRAYPNFKTKLLPWSSRKHHIPCHQICPVRILVMTSIWFLFLACVSSCFHQKPWYWVPTKLENRSSDLGKIDAAPRLGIFRWHMDHNLGTHLLGEYQGVQYVNLSDLRAIVSFGVCKIGWLTSHLGLERGLLERFSMWTKLHDCRSIAVSTTVSDVVRYKNMTHDH